MNSIKIIIASILIFAPAAYTDQKSRKIGIALALSGPAASFCTPVKNGIEMAIKDHSGKDGISIEAVYEDDRCEPKQTVTAVKKLLNIDKADFIITCTSGTSKAVSPITDKREIPHIAIATDPDVVKNKNYVVTLWVTPESETTPLISEIKKRNYKKIARITAQHAGMLAIKEVFDNVNSDNIVNIAIDQEVTEDSKDFRSFITKIKSVNDLDAVFVNLFVGSIGIFARQAREMGMTAPLFGYELFESKDDVEISNGALYDSWYVQADEGTTDFIKKYKENYPEAQTFAAANGYDAAMLLISALKSGADDSKSVAEYLHTVKNFSGALGTYSASGDNRFDLPAVIKEVKPEGFIKIN